MLAVHCAVMLCSNDRICTYRVPSDWENFFSRFCPGQNCISPGFDIGGVVAEKISISPDSGKQICHIV